MTTEQDIINRAVSEHKARKAREDRLSEIRIEVRRLEGELMAYDNEIRFIPQWELDLKDKIAAAIKADAECNDPPEMKLTPAQ